MYDPLTGWDISITVAHTRRHGLQNYDVPAVNARFLYTYTRLYDMRNASPFAIRSHARRDYARARNKDSSVATRCSRAFGLFYGQSNMKLN